MKNAILIAALACAPLLSAGAQAGAPASDVARWKAQAARVTIVRDDWGIAHVKGHTDADAVFGAIYAQAEDDFNRVETNYINAMGRLAEAEGEGEVYRDLRMKLYIQPDSLRKLYAQSPAWLSKLMVAWADGLNFYLNTHPQVKPRAITHFEPWMALSFSEGSIGGDIERISTAGLESFYGKPRTTSARAASPSEARRVARVEPADDGVYQEPGGSNGFAIAPKNTASHHAILWINPHTSFFFRSELQMTSDEGLNAYGASTWGQFFIYQGFNPNVGWMHTSSGVDNIDEYLETVSQKDGKWFYKYGNTLRPMVAQNIAVPYRTASGAMATKNFVVYRTLHGPVIREQDGKWVTIRMMADPLHALMQSYSRTKARSYAEFRQSLELHTNSSNNTVFADKQGDIAYFHSNFIPRRDTKFDWTKPVDGSDPATDWHGVLSVDETPHLLNPASGWLYNTNNAPWSAAGPSSPRKADFPAYVEAGSENPRGVHAVKVLSARHDFTPSLVIAAAFDSWMPAFDELLPPLFAAYDAQPDSVRRRLAEPMAALKSWDHRWNATSVPTTVAIYWGEALGRAVAADARRAGVPVDTFMVTGASAAQRLEALSSAVARLTADFGTWATPWGTVNRFQRLTGDIVQPFSDAGPSIPVPFASSRWGSLASFGARTYPGTKKMYGTSGNSFLAVVEFGDSVRARAVSAGGESGDPKSKHFDDQAERYASGNLREVYFYPSQLKGHTERTYHPGQ